MMLLEREHIGGAIKLMYVSSILTVLIGLFVRGILN